MVSICGKVLYQVTGFKGVKIDCMTLRLKVVTHSKDFELFNV